MGRTFDKIIGWTAFGLLLAGVAGYFYLAYGPDIAKSIDDIQKGRIGVA